MATIKQGAAQVVKAPSQTQGTQNGSKVTTGKDLRSR